MWRNKSHIRTTWPAETSRWVMFLLSRSNWQNHLNTSHQIIVVMWMCSAASCDFTWITTTGTKKGQKGNKENKLIEPDFLQTLWASEPKGFLLWSRQTRDCLDEMRCDAFIFFWGYDTQHSAETLITRRCAFFFCTRGSRTTSINTETRDMKHETWDMRHETGSCGGAGEANPPWWPPTPSCRESRHNTLFYIH